MAGTAPGGGPGGDETFLGWSGQNGYSTDVNGSYNAGFVLPYSGPNTTGGCPLLPGATGLCALAQGEGQTAFFGTDPQGTCPPTQEQANAGLVQCSIAALTANETGNSYIALALDVAYANDPTPANPTAAITPSSGLSAGQTVTVNACNTCNWWGAGTTGAPGFASPAGAGGKATAIPAPTVFMGATRASVVPVTNSTVAITPASYNCGSSGGAALSPPGPVATCILGAAPITNSSGTVTSGSTTLSDPAGAFTSKIVGDAIVVQGAGAGGSTLITTITGVTSASQLTLGTAAGTSISGSAVYTYGVSKEGTTGTTTASSSPVSCPTTGTIPASCNFTDTGATFTSSDLNKAITIYGAGVAGSPLITSIIAVTSATQVELAFEASTTIAGTAGYTYGTLRQGSTGTATASSTTFTDSSASFVSGDVGDDIVITGAGASGASLVTTIAAVNSSTSITLGTAAITSVAGSAKYAYGTPIQGTISGSFTVPSALTCGSSCHVYIDEPNTTLTNGNYSGGGSYNGGLTYNLVNAVEGSAAASCTTGCGTVSSPPTVTAVSPNNGPQAGTNTVTLTGTGFTGATAVDFGTSNPGTSIDVLSDTSLTVTAPSGSGTVDVTVTTPTGGTSSANPPSDHYTYNAPPTVTAVSPNNGPQAGTNTVTLTGTGFTGATAVDFGTSTRAPRSTCSVTTSLTVTAPSGTGTVDVTVTTPRRHLGRQSAERPLHLQRRRRRSPRSARTTGPRPGPTPSRSPAPASPAPPPSTSGPRTRAPRSTCSVTPSLTVTAPSGSGTVDVTVTTPTGGTSAANPPGDHYTYNVPPTVTNVSPNNGPPSGTNTVTVTGSGFVSGSTTVDFGANVGTSVNVSSSTSLTVVVPAGIGTVSVTVITTSGGASTPLANAYTYNAPPTVTAVSPNNGPQAGTNTVTLTGTGFTGATAVDFGTSNPGTSIDVLSDTSLTVTAPSGSGTVDVTVTTPTGGTSAANPPGDHYTYNAPPTVTNVSPNNGPPSGTNTVTVTGSGFVSGSTTVDFGANAGTSVNVSSSTSLTVVVPAGIGTVSVTVITTSGGASTPLANAYTYNAPPTVTAVSPNNGPQAGTNTVTLTGTGFTGATAVDFGTSNPGTSIDVLSDTSLTVTAPSGSGTVDVTVTTPTGGTSAANPPGDHYTYNAPPTVTNVSPNNGPPSGTNTVTVTGSGFVSGSTTVDFGANAGTSVNVSSSTSLTVVVPAGIGTVSVTVITTSGGASTPLANAYTYNAPPTVTAVSPNNGPQAGTNTVTLTGTGFTGATAVDFGTSNPGTSIDVLSDTSLTVTAPSGSGTVDVTVTTPTGGTSAANPPGDHYTYNAPPTVTNVSPNNGPPSGTNTVTVTGSGFVSGSTTVDFGANAGTSVNVSSSTSLTVVVPAGIGTVSVTVITTSGGASTPLANAYTYNGSSTPGGAVTTTKVTALIGNYPEKVSGTGWAVNGDTTVTVNQCASTTYSAATCDAANQVSATLGTGSQTGIFKSAVIELAVGRIDSNGDTCGLSSSVPCYVVVVGNTGDSTASAALGFTLPSFTVHKTTAVLGNYVDSVKASGIPIGDTVTAQECDGSVVVPATVSTHCDGATQISGTSGTNGKVVFTSTGVTLRVGSPYTDSASGSCSFGGTCDIGVVDSDNADVGAAVAVAFATPAIAVHKTTAALGNYVDAVKATGFPIGDTVVAQECDASVSVPATVATHCDAATQISGTVAATGGVVFSPTGVTLRVGSAYADSASGSCQVGGICDIGVTDSQNSAVGLSEGVAFATPTIAVHKTTGVLGNYVDAVKATNFPIGDTIVAQECDPSVVIPTTVGSHCDAATENSGTSAANGVVTFGSAGVPIAVGGAYVDGASGTCPAGGTCDIVVTDSNNAAIGLEVAVTFATPTASVHVATNVPANYVDKVTAGSFPIGDTVTAQECDASVTASNVGTNCDNATQITGTVGSTGTVTFSASGVPIRVGSAYSDGASGTCPAGGSCDVVVTDSTHSGFYIAISVGLAS